MGSFPDFSLSKIHYRYMERLLIYFTCVCVCSGTHTCMCACGEQRIRNTIHSILDIVSHGMVTLTPGATFNARNCFSGLPLTLGCGRVNSIITPFPLFISHVLTSPPPGMPRLCPPSAVIIHLYHYALLFTPFREFELRPSLFPGKYFSC